MDGKVVSAIGPGLCVLVGLHQQDDDNDVEYMYATPIAPSVTDLPGQAA